MISGLTLRDAIISGANAIQNRKNAVDELNIFPVPDGDTGTNMSMTMSSARNELLGLEAGTAGEIAGKAATALLRGARGNSGVILSLLFRGFSKGLKGVDEATGSDLANALTLGVEAAYKAVMKPTEGTILTVARVASERGRAVAEINNSPLAVWDAICESAEAALATTPDLLPVLKRAGVVDAGGQGLCYIFRGMQSVFTDGAIVELNESKETVADVDSFKSVIAEFDGVVNYSYNTELIISKENDNSPAELRIYLESIGDCVVVVDDSEVIKAHLHTDRPGDAVTRALTYGQLISTCIENLTELKTDAASVGAAPAKALQRVEPVEGVIGFVSVAAGAGLISLFHDLGCEQVVSGGQTMNPSTDDILAAVQATAASTVFVLPNNKNIIMAAEQSIPLADRRVIVLPTTTIPQGIAAMLAYDPESNEDANSVVMMGAAENVSTGKITFAARDSEFDNRKIKEGDILALNNKKLVFLDKDPIHAAAKLCKQMVTRETSFITVIYGEGITDAQGEELRKIIESKVTKDAEVTLVNGGQPVYYFILSIE